MGRVVLFAKSKEEIEKERRALFATYYQEYAELNSAWEIAEAALYGTVIAKKFSSRAEMTAVFDLRMLEIKIDALSKMKTAVEKLTAGVKRLDEIAKRSERYFGGAV